MALIEICRCRFNRSMAAGPAASLNVTRLRSCTSSPVPVPLPVLEQQIQAYIAERKKA